jgi:integrase
MMLLKGHGMRVSDLRLLGRRNRNGATLSFVTVKTGRLCEHPIDQDTLQAIHQFDGDVWLLNEAGLPYASDKALSQRIAKWFRQAGVFGITAHSVRKWLATRFADKGATEYEMMAWFGWSDPKEARPYVQAANRRALSQSAGRILAFHRGR